MFQYQPLSTQNSPQYPAEIADDAACPGYSSYVKKQSQDDSLKITMPNENIITIQTKDLNNECKTKHSESNE